MTAVIFDLDGVLVDSEPLWQQGFADVVNAFCVEQGREDPRLTRDDMARFHGGRVKDTLRTLVEEQQLGDRLSDETLTDLTDRVVADAAAQLSDEVVIQSSVDVARRLHKDGIPLGVASSSALGFIEAVVDRLALGDAFRVIQSALDLEHGKPDPEVYELTLQRLRADRATTLAIEDSVPGVRSALRAGLSVVWLTPQEEGEALSLLDGDDPSGVRLVTETLDYDEVRHLMGDLG